MASFSRLRGFNSKILTSNHLCYADFAEHPRIRVPYKFSESYLHLVVGPLDIFWAQSLASWRTQTICQNKIIHSNLYISVPEHSCQVAPKLGGVDVGAVLSHTATLLPLLQFNKQKQNWISGNNPKLPTSIGEIRDRKCRISIPFVWDE